MKKNHIFTISFFVILGLVFSVYQHMDTLKIDLVNAADTKPANGHSWFEMESDADSIQVSGRTITNLAAPVAATDAANKEYVDAASGPACPTNYANLCTNGGGLAFTYSGRTMYIDAFPRSSAWHTSGSPAGQSLAWQICGAIGARLPTLAEWQAACTALNGPNGNGMTQFGGLNIATRYEWVANPSSANINHAVLAGGGSCTGASATNVLDYNVTYWFRCVR